MEPTAQISADHLTGRLRDLYDLLAAAAEAGLPCPSNTDLMDKGIVVGDHTRCTEALQRLSKMGLIKIEAGVNWRRVTVLATGKATAKSNGSRQGRVRRMAPSALGGATVNIRPAKRTCLRCRRKFESQGPHNQMCGPCRNAASEIAA
ncbi:hypothetical protein [Telmatospirillum sp. J64-1]|uniref:hypothetical protein n=1 Tax=Telmatospirillum sp. J64-1 TaxID=2502183 RepID=UPI00115CF910|nr:hypothetical protein [Telmatospirillum sp. J64-1]